MKPSRLTRLSVCLAALLFAGTLCVVAPLAGQETKPSAKPAASAKDTAMKSRGAGADSNIKKNEVQNDLGNATMTAPNKSADKIPRAGLLRVCGPRGQPCGPLHQYLPGWKSGRPCGTWRGSLHPHRKRSVVALWPRSLYGRFLAELGTACLRLRGRIHLADPTLRRSQAARSRPRDCGSGAQTGKPVEAPWRSLHLPRRGVASFTPTFLPRP